MMRNVSSISGLPRLWCEVKELGNKESFDGVVSLMEIEKREQRTRGN